MDLKRLLQESFRRPTPAKVAMHLFKALTECDDATLISLLIEDDGSPLSADDIQGVLNDPTQPAQPPKDDTAYTSALSKKLMSTSGSFAEKVFEIFKGIYKTTDNNDTLALMRKRPAVAQAADYIIKLYGQYAQSKEVLNAMAAVKNPNAVRDALPRLTGKVPQGMATHVQDTFAKLVEINIVANTIDFMQSDEAKNLAWGIPDGSDEVTPKDVDAAGGKHEAPPAKPAGKSDKPDFRISYVDYKDAIANRRMNLNELYTYSGWLTILSLVASHYESTLVKYFQLANAEKFPLHQIPDTTKVYQFTKGQVPVGRDVEVYADTIAAVGDSRNAGKKVPAQGPSYYGNQIIAVNQLGPFYNLEALFQMAGGSVTHDSFYCCVLALEYLDDFIKKDLLEVKGSGTVRIKPVSR